MNLVLSTSPHIRHPVVLEREFEPATSVAYSFSPVGLLSLVAVVRQEMATEPTLFDLNRKIREGSIELNSNFYRSAAKALEQHQPDIVGFMTECDSYHHILQIAEEAKNQMPSCRIVLGGPHATAVARQTITKCPYVDAIVMGEGEVSFPRLLKTFSEGPIVAVPGVLLRTDSGHVLDGGNAPLVESLDELPQAAYELYSPDPGEEIFIEVGRGCPFQCSFCSTAPFWKRRHRVKSPERILAELQTVQKLFGTNRVHFTHDLLTTDRQWVKALCLTLIEAGVPALWTCSARTDTVDEELIALMGAAGCNAIYFGIESGSQRILHEIKKDISVTHSLEVLGLCRKHGISPNAGFIAGFPSEDLVSLEETFGSFTAALRIGCRPTHIFGFCPFAQSSIYPSLNAIECTGHFIDLPLGPSMDRANRLRIAQDPELYGSYFRPSLPELEELIPGIDEFSCLVDATLVPALELERCVGGMSKVYEGWTKWISAKNAAHGHVDHRRFYGSPLSFCDFLIERLQNLPSVEEYAIQLAQVIRINLKIAAGWNGLSPTSMGEHRSLPLPKGITKVVANDRLALTGVLAKIKVDFDVSNLLSGRLDEFRPPVRRPSCLVWHVHSDGHIRLVEVDPFLFWTIGMLETAPSTAAELAKKWTTDSYAPKGAGVLFEEILRELTEATEAGFVRVNEHDQN